MSTIVYAAAIKYLREARNIIKEQTGVDVKIDAVEISNRMTKTFGKARREDGRNIILLAGKVFKKDSPELRNTVFHEVAHHADYQIHGGWGHDASWQRVMVMLGESPEQYVSKEKQEAIGYVYQPRRQERHSVKCVRCGSIHKITSYKLNKLSMYRCACGGNLAA